MEFSKSLKNGYFFSMNIRIKQIKKMIQKNLKFPMGSLNTNNKIYRINRLLKPQ